MPALRPIALPSYPMADAEAESAARSIKDERKQLDAFRGLRAQFRLALYLTRELGAPAWADCLALNRDDPFGHVDFLGCDVKDSWVEGTLVDALANYRLHVPDHLDAEYYLQTLTQVVGASRPLVFFACWIRSAEVRYMAELGLVEHEHYSGKYLVPFSVCHPAEHFLRLASQLWPAPAHTESE